MLPFTLVAGHQKIITFTRTLKSAQFFLKTFFKHSTGGKAYFKFFIAKNEEKLKKKILAQIKNSIADFGKKKNIY